MALAQVDPTQVEKAYALIEKGPVTFVAALFAVTSVTLLVMLLRTIEKGRTREARSARAHAEELTELHQSYTVKLQAFHEREMERSLKLQAVAHGMLQLVELGAIDVRRGKTKPSKDRDREPRTNPGNAPLLPSPREEPDG